MHYEQKSFWILKSRRKSSSGGIESDVRAVFNEHFSVRIICD